MVHVDHVDYMDHMDYVDRVVFSVFIKDTINTKSQNTAAGSVERRVVGSGRAELNPLLGLLSCPHVTAVVVKDGRTAPLIKRSAILRHLAVTCHSTV